MPDTRPHLLIAGVTTRALATSAARSGWRVTAVDAFGDLDLRAVAEVLALTRAAGGFTAEAAALAAREVAADAVAYTSNFENHPGAVARLARGRELLGNAPEVLQAARRPIALMRVLDRRGFAVPRTRASAPRPGDAATGAWLLKPRRSGGGRGIQLWRTGRVPRTHYLQERIRGVPGSVVFLADGRRVHSLGLTRQLVGEPAFGAHRFAYCGSLLGSPDAPLFRREPELRAAAEALAAAVTEEFGLRGLNGIDFIARDGIPFPIEVNPRVCASMELVERLGGAPLFPLHRDACRGMLPAGATLVARRVAGKAVVFARRTVVAADLRALRAAAADLPHPGERIRRGHPICTVFADGRDAAECVRGLTARAREVFDLLEPRARGAA